VKLSIRRKGIPSALQHHLAT